MNCDTVRENLALHLYGELPDDARFGLEQHLGNCSECQGEWQSMQAFRASMDSLPLLEPSPNLLAASRMHLHDKLESAHQAAGWRLVLDPVAWLRQMRFAPALAAAILMVGFTAGVLTTFRTIGRNNPGAARPAPASEASIAGISGITQEPGSNNVQIKYDTLQPQTVNGSLDDPKVEQLLLYAARNQQNPGVRVESMDLLSQKAADPHVREALIYALRYDPNPGCRLKALDGLEAYVKSDLRVRDAVTEALLYDSSTGVRIDALRLLQPVKADSSVRAALQQLAKADSNAYIRSESGHMLASMSNIE
jgi:putative zinc finger protein